MKTEYTAEDLRDIYGEYCADNRITEAPEADDLTAEDLAEMVEEFEFRTERADRLPYSVAVEVVGDWLEDWLIAHGF